MDNAELVQRLEHIYAAANDIDQLRRNARSQMSTVRLRLRGLIADIDKERRTRTPCAHPDCPGAETYDGRIEGCGRDRGQDPEELTDCPFTQRAAAIQKLLGTDAGHTYLSTACAHGEHAQCRKTCKFCSEPCLCSCHAEESS